MKLEGIAALIPSSTDPNADPYSDDTLDRRAVADLTEKLIGDGADSIVAAGSFGESHTLTDKELVGLSEAILEGVSRSRKPDTRVFVGTTSLNTRESIRKTRLIRSVGIEGVMNGVPMYLPLSMDNYVRYYEDLAEHCPGLQIILYPNPSVFRVNPDAETWARLGRVPGVVGVKAVKANYATILETGADIGVLVPESLAVEALQAGASGLWSMQMSMGGAPTVALYRLCKAGDFERALSLLQDIKACALSQRLSWPDFIANVTSATKAAIDAAGYGRGGPGRPPFMSIPEAVVREVTACGREWAQLDAKVRAELLPQVP